MPSLLTLLNGQVVSVTDDVDPICDRVCMSLIGRESPPFVEVTKAHTGRPLRILAVHVVTVEEKV